MAKKADIRFDEERSVEVLNTALEYYRNSGYVSHEEQILEAAEGLTNHQKAYVLFAWGYLNVLQKADTLFKPFINRLWQKPWLINMDFHYPHVLANDLVISCLSLTPRSDLLLQWDDAVRKIRCYDSDPRMIFIEKGRDRNSAIKTLRKIDGIGPKLAQLLIIFFQQFALYDPHFAENWPEHKEIIAIPADSHWQKFVLQTGILVSWSTDNCLPASNAISDFICNICAKYNLSHIDVHYAVWTLMSEICTKKNCSNCPISKYCGLIVKPTDKEIRSGKTGWNSAVSRVR